MKKSFGISILLVLCFFGWIDMIEGDKINCKERRAECIKEFLKRGLDKHNEYRARHNCVPLKQDPAVDKIAQAYAEKLIKNNKFEHSKAKGLGENLYVIGGSGVNFQDFRGRGKDATDAWYSEICVYDFENGKFNGAGHFTQLLWNKSTHIGQGVGVTEKNNKVIIVSNYRPAGNLAYSSSLKANVPLPVKPTVDEICKNTKGYKSKVNSISGTGIIDANKILEFLSCVVFATSLLMILG